MYNMIIGNNLQNVHLGNVPNWTKQDKGENDMDKARESALKVLYKIDVENGYSNIVLNDEIKSKKDGLNSKDIGLISEIVYGVTTWKLTLDEIIKKYSKIRLKKISPWIINILRMSIYQIIFLDKIPVSASVNEGVNLAKRYGNRGSIGFVNAVLRKVSKKDYEELFNEKEELKRISKTTSMPEWIIQRLKKDGLTVKEIEDICKNSNIKPKISIRTNNTKICKEDLKIRLEEKGISSTDGILNDFLILDKVKDIENMEEFKSGLFTVQDEVAGLTALVLNPKPGEKVLDACSSPGGKTTYLAEIMCNKGKIEAWDIHEHRTKLVQNAAKRLNLEIISTNVQDATIYNEKYKESFDKILLDVPCLGIGVLKRKPDIKWQKQENDIEEISKIQYEILKTCFKYLKSGGKLVYSTCSILKEENEKIIEKFIKNNKNAVIENINFEESEKLKDEKNAEKFFTKYIKQNKYLQVYQNEKTDGFFICKIAKN